jgi:hypothetical protein
MGASPNRSYDPTPLTYAVHNTWDEIMFTQRNVSKYLLIHWDLASCTHRELLWFLVCSASLTFPILSVILCILRQEPHRAHRQRSFQLPVKCSNRLSRPHKTHPGTLNKLKFPTKTLKNETGHRGRFRYSLPKDVSFSLARFRRWSDQIGILGSSLPIVWMNIQFFPPLNWFPKKDIAFNN